jgi:hypothetical protein
MFALTVLYSGLFFYVRVRAREFRKFTSTSDNTGTLETGGSVHSKDSHITTKTVSNTTEPAIQNRQPRMGISAHRRMTYISYTLLLYPTAYMVLTLPISIARFYEFVGRSFTLRSLYIGATMFDLQGFVNVILYTTTRKGIIPWDRIFGKFKRFTPKTPQSTFSSYTTDTYDLPTAPRPLVSKPLEDSVTTLNHSSMQNSSVEYYSEMEINLPEYVISDSERTAGIQNTINDRTRTDVCG